MMSFTSWDVSQKNSRKSSCKSTPDMENNKYFCLAKKILWLFFAFFWTFQLAAGGTILHKSRDGVSFQINKIALRYPEMRLIIDHMGYPDPETGPEPFEPILELAKHKNIYIKISDVKGRSKLAFPFSDVHPFIKNLLNVFGIERAMWGTGYPGHHREKNNWLYKEAL